MAAELIKEVSKAIVLIPASLVWPFVPFVIEVRKTLTIKKQY